MNIKFEINGNEIPKQDIKTASNRIKFTTTIDKDYLNEFRNLCKYLDSNMNDGIEVFIEMISNDKDLLQQYMTNLKSRNTKRYNHHIENAFAKYKQDNL